LLAENVAVTVPAQPRIYHITHVDNLAGIVADRALWSDAMMVDRGGPKTMIGMSDIKRRRLQELHVTCYPDNFVGEYVPFFFCPRSVMLYLIYMGNHPELVYRGGQEPILHLEADLYDSVSWADSIPRRWAFALTNAGARYTQFRNDLADLGDLDWDAIANTDFRNSAVKEKKMAEFLMYESFPWDLVRSIGVHSDAVAVQVNGILAGAARVPSVSVRRDWYY
jgi:hypothetical protein